jgi:hypothetical protein
MTSVTSKVVPSSEGGLWGIEVLAGRDSEAFVALLAVNARMAVPR